MSRKSDDAALLAEFLAKGNKATQCAPNSRTMTEREIYNANRGIKSAPSSNSNSIVWRVITDHAGREFYQNAQGEYL